MQSAPHPLGRGALVVPPRFRAGDSRGRRSRALLPITGLPAPHNPPRFPRRAPGGFSSRAAVGLAPAPTRWARRARLLVPVIALRCAVVQAPRGRPWGGQERTRTSDPHDVNVVL